MAAFRRAQNFVRIAEEDFYHEFPNSPEIDNNDQLEEDKIDIAHNSFESSHSENDDTNCSEEDEDVIVEDNSSDDESLEEVSRDEYIGGGNQVRRTIGFILPKIHDDGSSGFCCKICPKVKLVKESDAASHVSSKGHRKAFNVFTKSKWTPEMIQARKDKNKRKRLKRIEKHKEEQKKKKKLKNEHEEQPTIVEKKKK